MNADQQTVNSIDLMETPRGDSAPERSRPLVSVVLPCLNEEEAIGICLEKLKAMFAREGINGEIVVSDNGSTDRSVEIAMSMDVVVCHQPERGYGNAYLMGMEVAKGDYLVMADADDTYDFNLIPTFLKMLANEHYDFVTGSRYLEGGDAHITFLHRFVGNPALTAALNVLFGTKYTDVYCGFRAFSRQAYDLIRPLSPGMEFNLELAVNAKLAQLKIAEIPIVLAPRLGKSKLHTLKDGWRSLRLMILYCPNKVFLIPGLTLLLSGAVLHLLLLARVLSYQGRLPGAVSGIVALILCVAGFQVISLWLHAKTYSWSRRFDTDNNFLRSFYKHFNLEAGLVLGSGLVLMGVAIFAVILRSWFIHDMMPLSKPEWAPFAATLMIIGNSCIFSSIFISAMSMRRKPSN